MIKLDWMNELRRLESNTLLSYESKFNLLKAYGKREETRINKEFNNIHKQKKELKKLKQSVDKAFKLGSY